MRAATVAQSASVSVGSRSNASRTSCALEPSTAIDRRCSPISWSSTDVSSRSRMTPAATRSASETISIASNARSVARSWSARSSAASGEKSVSSSS